MDPVLLTVLCFAHLSANTIGVFSDCKSSALTEVMAIAAPITEALFLKNKQLLISNKSLIFLFLEPAMTIKLIPGSHSHILSLSLSLTHTHTHTHTHTRMHTRTHARIHTHSIPGRIPIPPPPNSALLSTNEQFCIFIASIPTVEFPDSLLKIFFIINAWARLMCRAPPNWALF